MLGLTAAFLTFSLRYAIIITKYNGWTKELNYISWDDREPVYDIRTWSSDHSEYGKGVTVTAGEMKRLQELIKDSIVF